MQRFKKRFAVPVGLLLFFSVYYACLSFFLKPETIQKNLVENIESLTGGELQFESFRVMSFPNLSTEFQGVNLSVPGATSLQLRTQKAKFYFNPWHFLLGKFVISRVDVKAGEMDFNFSERFPFGKLHIERIDLKAGPLKSHGLVKLELRGDLEGAINSFIAKVQFDPEALKKGDWPSAVLDGSVTLADLPLQRISGKHFKDNSFAVKEGVISGDYRFQKKIQDSWLEITGNSQLRGLVYENRTGLSSSPIEASLELEAGWDPAAEELILRNSLLRFPNGQVESQGSFFLTTRELKGVRIMVSGIALEDIPQHFLPLKEVIPFNLGFSGKSDLEMSGEGTLDHLSLHANWDFTQSLLTYSSYFLKPKDFPMTLGFDFLLRDGAVLSGDFSLKLQDAVFKGTLSKLDFGSGDGQMNVLTNKFKLEGLRDTLPIFEKYDIQGDAKILANLDGNFLKRPDEVRNMVNVTLENGTIVKKDGPDLRNVFISMDAGAVSLELKRAEFQVGEFPVSLNMLIYNPWTQPVAKANLVSAELDVYRFLSAFEAFGEDFFPESFEGKIAQFKSGLGNALPSDQTLEELSMTVGYKDNEWTLEDMAFQAYGGSVRAKGAMHLKANPSSFTLSSEMEHVNLSKFFSRNIKDSKVMDGNLFLKMKLEGESLDFQNWRESLKGEGEFSITNGEFYTFGILKTLAGLDDFSLLKSYASEGTLFDDFRSGFRLEKGKVLTENLLMISRELRVQGEGDVNFDGFLNFRLNTFIAWPLAGPLLEPFLGKFQENRGDQFGPIPMLLSGALEKPELKPDPIPFAELQEKLEKKKTHEVLRNFLPEDFLFKRPNNS